MSFDENQLGGSPFASPENPPARQGSANLLLFTGFCLIAVSVALAAAHEYSAAAERIADKLAGRGLGWDVVGALGATLFGLGLVGRGAGRLGARIEGLRNEQIDLALLQERVVGELADLRATSDRSRLSAPAQQDLSAVAGAGAAQSDKEALYRMAASLDQLSGRLEKRVQTDLASLAKELERVSTAIAKLEQRVGQTDAKRPAPARAAAAAPAAAGRAPAPAPVPPAPIAPFAPLPRKDEDGPIVIDLDAQERALELFDRMDVPETEDEDGNPRPTGAPLPGKRGPGPQKAPAKELERLMAEKRRREGN